MGLVGVRGESKTVPVLSMGTIARLWLGLVTGTFLQNHVERGLF